MSDLLRQVAASYDQSLPPDLLANAPKPPTPTVSALAPASIVAGDPAAEVLVTGTLFDAGSKVWADEEGQITTFVSETQLTYNAQADQAGTQSITVRNGSRISNVIELTVTATAVEEEGQPTPEVQQRPEGPGAARATPRPRKPKDSTG